MQSLCRKLSANDSTTHRITPPQRDSNAISAVRAILQSSYRNDDINGFPILFLIPFVESYRRTALMTETLFSSDYKSEPYWMEDIESSTAATSVKVVAPEMADK